jgi:hypothetical protein
MVSIDQFLNKVSWKINETTITIDNFTEKISKDDLEYFLFFLGKDDEPTTPFFIKLDPLIIGYDVTHIYFSILVGDISSMLTLPLNKHKNTLSASIIDVIDILYTKLSAYE